jgi:UDP-2,4-diacetamido-2,4,6-trideoxy-beta-L-altropyranose hydrolase
MKVVFRADAAAANGGGHVMRCMSLAGELARRGCTILFLCHRDSSSVVPALARSGFPLAEAGDTPDQATAALRTHFPDGADILIFDSYTIDAVYERILRPAARRVVVIDDLADRPHDCDVLLDTAWVRNPLDYAGLVPAHARILTGPGYALLRPEFAILRAAALAKRGIGRPARRVLVSLGLTDVGGITARVTRAILDLGRDILLDVVIGPTAASSAELELLSRTARGLALHIDPLDIAGLMANADLAIGAGGTTTWERCCLGLPTLTLPVVPHQRDFLLPLAALGALVMVDAEDRASFITCLCKLLDDPRALSEIANRAARICDGKGAARVAAEITTL